MRSRKSLTLQRGNRWGSGIAEWIEGNTVYLSVVFSWLLDKAVTRMAGLMSQGFDVKIGGPAAKYAGLQDGDGIPETVKRHNPDAVFTSSGCPSRCAFCVVGQTDGDLVEFDEWVPAPVVCDNNLTATSKRHFDRVVDSLKGIPNVDINQGMSAALITDHQASRLAELDMKCVRLAWDSAAYESSFMRGWDILRKAGFSRSRIGVYVLIGYDDTPADALHRLETVYRLGGMPFPMRYQSLDAPKRNSYVGENWTHNELARFVRYWSNLRLTSRIPFADFVYPPPKGV